MIHSTGAPAISVFPSHYSSVEEPAQRLQILAAATDALFSKYGPVAKKMLASSEVEGALRSDWDWAVSNWQSVDNILNKRYKEFQNTILKSLVERFGRGALERLEIREDTLLLPRQLQILEEALQKPPAETAPPSPFFPEKPESEKFLPELERLPEEDFLQISAEDFDFLIDFLGMSSDQIQTLCKKPEKEFLSEAAVRILYSEKIPSHSLLKQFEDLHHFGVNLPFRVRFLKSLVLGKSLPSINPAQISDQDRDFISHFFGEVDSGVLDILCQFPEAFLKTAERRLADLQSSKGKPDPVLVKRLEAARDLPIEIRIGILKTIHERMGNAQEFWREIEGLYFEFPGSEKSIDEIVNKCFSVYASGILRCTPKTIEDIKNVLKRTQMRDELANHWHELLGLDSLASSSKGIPSGDLLQRALQAQYVLESSVSHQLEKVDRLKGLLNQRANEEIALLQLFLSVPEAEQEEFIQKLEKRDQKFLKELMSKVEDLQSQALSRIVSQNIEQRESLLMEVEDKGTAYDSQRIRNEIVLLQKFLKEPEAKGEEFLRNVNSKERALLEPLVLQAFAHVPVSQIVNESIEQRVRLLEVAEYDEVAANVKRAEEARARKEMTLAALRKEFEFSKIPDSETSYLYAKTLLLQAYRAVPQSGKDSFVLGLATRDQQLSDELLKCASWIENNPYDSFVAREHKLRGVLETLSEKTILLSTLLRIPPKDRNTFVEALVKRDVKKVKGFVNDDKSAALKLIMVSDQIFNEEPDKIPGHRNSLSQKFTLWPYAHQFYSQPFPESRPLAPAVLQGEVEREMKLLLAFQKVNREFLIHWLNDPERLPSDVNQPLFLAYQQAKNKESLIHGLVEQDRALLKQILPKKTNIEELLSHAGQIRKESKEFLIQGLLQGDKEQLCRILSEYEFDDLLERTGEIRRDVPISPTDVLRRTLDTFAGESILLSYFREVDDKESFIQNLVAEDKPALEKQLTLSPRNVDRLLEASAQILEEDFAKYPRPVTEEAKADALRNKFRAMSFGLEEMEAEAPNTIRQVLLRSPYPLQKADEYLKAESDRMQFLLAQTRLLSAYRKIPEGQRESFIIEVSERNKKAEQALKRMTRRNDIQDLFDAAALVLKKQELGGKTPVQVLRDMLNGLDLSNSMELDSVMQGYFVLSTGNIFLDEQAEWVHVKLSKAVRKGDPKKKEAILSSEGSRALLEFIQEGRSRSKEAPGSYQFSTGIWLNYKDGEYSLSVTKDGSPNNTGDLFVSLIPAASDLIRTASVLGQKARVNSDLVPVIQNGGGRIVMMARSSGKGLVRMVNKENSKWRRTAGLNRAKAIQANRQFAHVVLSGNLGRIPASRLGHYQEFIDAINGDKIASRPKSYQKDPVYIEMHQLSSPIRTQSEKFSRDQFLSEALLETREKTIYSWSSEKQRVMQLLIACETFVSWIEPIQTFLNFVKNDKELQGQLKEMVSYFEILKQACQNLYDKLPRIFRDIVRDVISEKATTGRSGVDADKYYALWKERSSQEIENLFDQMLPDYTRAMESIIHCMTKLSPYTVGKINPETNKYDPLTGPMFDLTNKLTAAEERMKKARIEIPGELGRFGIEVYFDQYMKAKINGKKGILVDVAKDLLKGTEPSPTWLQFVDLLGATKTWVNKSELIRARDTHRDIRGT